LEEVRVLFIVENALLPIRRRIDWPHAGAIVMPYRSQKIFIARREKKVSNIFADLLLLSPLTHDPNHLFMRI
jgi:hypothetical protein